MEISYSLGDAIDWKRSYPSIPAIPNDISYSLGDAINWKCWLNIGIVHEYESPTC